jgi:oligopeptide/dipeptide ABC transporter ATP-binding protein
MYAGEIVESGQTSQLIRNPLHPYTEALLNSRPGSMPSHIERKPKTALPSISGIVPAFHQRPLGCQFNPRCDYVKPECQNSKITIEKINNKSFESNEIVEGSVRCLFPLFGVNKK